MAKTLPTIGPYEVISDTNALFAQDPRKLVSAGFESALTELRKIAQIHLHIPHTVLGELAYRKYLAAETAHGSAVQNWTTINSITGIPSPRLVSNQTIKRKIVKRYEAWLKGIDAKPLKPKIAQQRWEQLVQDAIWRISPFEHSDDTKHEKGFRDRVILESVIQFCKEKNHEVIFLCNDGRLKDEAARRCGSKLTIVPRLEDFASRVRLLKDNSEKEWVEELFRAASDEFYKEGNSDCLYYRAKIYEAISARIEDLTPPGPSLEKLLYPTAWDRKTDEKITLGTTQFEKYDEERGIWMTEIKSAAAFSGKNVIELLHEEIRVSTFLVRWSSQISENAEVKDAKIVSIEFRDHHMSSDTQDERTRWSLPPKSPQFNWWDLGKLSSPPTQAGQSPSQS